MEGREKNDDNLMDTETVEDVDSDPESDNEVDSDDESSDVLIQELSSKISASPFQYDLHLQLIQLLRKQGELDKLRKAREHMSELFPLTEELWLEWINDEKKWLDGNSGRANVIKLFERAVKDYLSPGVWLEYAQFCLGDIASEEGITTARNVCEKAIIAVGLHVAKGSSVWEVYREFESALLMTMQPSPGSIPTKDQEVKVENQTKKIDSIFRRQLGVPLLNMEQTFDEYEGWLGESIPDDIKHKFNRTLAQLQKYQPFEDSLDDGHDSPHLKEYRSYLEFVKSNSDPATTQCLYERAVQDNCLVSDLWLDYTQYLNNQLKIPSIILDVYRRSVANCPWCLRLWQGYLRALEKHDQPQQKVSDEFQKALIAGFPQTSEYLEIWLTLIDYLRRRIDWTTEHTKELDEFRTTTDRATEYLSQYFGTDGDPAFTLQQYRARIEAKHCKNMERAREIWNDILAAGLGNKAYLWMEYFNLERSCGDTKHCRKILQRAVNSVSDWPETVCTAFLNFEREEGTLETFESAMRRVEAQMKRIKEQREKQQQESDFAKWDDRRDHHRRKEFHHSERWGNSGHEKQQWKKGKSGLGWKEDSKRKESKPQRKETTKRKVSKNEEVTSAPIKKMKFVSQQEEEQKDVFKVPAIPIASPTRKTAPSLPSVPHEAAEIKEVEDAEAIGKEESMEVSSSSPTSETKEEELDPEKQSLTVFIKNLSYDAIKEDIQNVMSKCGEIKDVRMVCNYQKKFRGFCYVEFAKDESVEEALKMDRDLLHGRHMFIDRYIDKKKAQKPKMDFKYEQKMERNKLFVSNLPRSATKEDLTLLFQQYGTVKDVRLVTYKSGVSKGLAYIEYENEVDASKALIGADQTKMEDHSICVAISNPPSRKQPAKERPAERQEDFPKSLGAKGVSGPRGKGRTQLSMVPRSIQKPPVTGSEASSKQLITTQQKGEAEPPETPKTADDETEGDAEGQKRKMLSNADFAKMLLKK